MTTFIAIEGIDGSGKATQANLLAESLRYAGVSTAVVSFPDYTTTYGKKIAAYLRGEYGELKDLHPDLIAPLYALNRCELRGSIQRAGLDNKVVIFDRYTGSNLAHQGSKVREAGTRLEFYDELLDTEIRLLNATAPRMTFFLDVAVTAAQTNVDSKEVRAYTSAVRDLQEANTSHLTSAREAYLEIAALKHWTIIDCAKDGVMRPADEIADQIFTCFVTRVGMKNVIY
jgi:dTMP kinase